MPTKLKRGGRPGGQFSDEVRARLREIYVQGEMSYTDLAAMSAELVGQKISFDRLKTYARNDPAGAWEVARNERLSQLASQNQPDIFTEVEFVRQALYQEIVRQATGGLIILGAKADQKAEIAQRLKGLNLQVVESSSGLDAQIVRAYFDALSKLNISVQAMRPTSAKTSRQRALEIMNQADRAAQHE
jgi:hypothetical protein